MAGEKAFTTGGGDLYSEEGLFSYQHVLETVRRRLNGAKELVKFLIIFGVNRGGTTALQLLAAQFEDVCLAEFQPFKDILRHGAARSTSLSYREGDLWQGGTVVLKEALGPLRQAECTLDPFRFLLEAGISLADISAIFILRDPRKAYYSWTQLIDTNPAPFCLSQQSVVKTYYTYRDRLRACVPLYYGMLRQEAVLRETFRRVGLDNGLRLGFNSDLLRRKVRWNEADPESRGEQGKHYWEAVVAPMVQRGSFQYVSRPSPPLALAEKEYLDREALPQYQEWQRLCDESFA